jgi:hypothetical protein
MSEWHVFEVTIHPESPLHLGAEGRGETFVETREEITGAMLRGAIAARLLGDCTQRQYMKDHAACPARHECSFWRVFGDQQQPSFGFGYAGATGSAYPMPLTARTCKHNPGYSSGAPHAHSAHGVFDTLIDQFTFELLSDIEFFMRAILQPKLAGRMARLTAFPNDRCPTCGAAASLERVRHFRDEPSDG